MWSADRCGWWVACCGGFVARALALAFRAGFAGGYFLFLGAWVWPGLLFVRGVAGVGGGGTCRRLGISDRRM